MFPVEQIFYVEWFLTLVGHCQISNKFAEPLLDCCCLPGNEQSEIELSKNSCWTVEKT